MTVTMTSWQFRYALLVLLPLLLLLVSELGYLGNTTAILVNLPGWLLVEDLILGYSWSDAGWIGSLLASWVFWFLIGWTLAQLALRHHARAAVVGLILVLGVTYLAFRTTKTAGYTLDRSWGFITHATRDSNLDGTADEEAWYSWREPLFDAHSRPVRSRSDQNFDGLWDTWVDHATGTLEIDTDGDGVGDTTLSADYSGYKRARELRGF